MDLPAMEVVVKVSLEKEDCQYRFLLDMYHGSRL
jgi:hypothetical protein